MSHAQLWMQYGLDCGGPGATPRPTLSNAVKVLEHDKVLSGTIYYDEFLDRILVTVPGAAPREWIDADDLNLTVEFQDRIGMATIQSGIIRDAVHQYAFRRRRNAVKDWMHALVWDGVPRIDHAFEDHWGVNCGRDQPCDYVRAVSHNFFVGIVARAMNPGCQRDEMVVFESKKQGTRKSTALHLLAGDWFAVAHERVTEKDFFQDIQGKLIIEIAEMSSFSRAQVERIKTVISTRIDRFRGSYDHRSSDHPRRGVFAGTTNRDDWGEDETGLRRFWPVAVGEINLDTLAAAREHLFAEAVALYLSGGAWWNVPDSTSDVQAQRQNYDEWTSLVMPWVELERVKGVPFVSIASILGTALKISPERADKSTQMRVARILTLNHWTKRTIREGRTIMKAWYPPDEP